MFGWLKKTVLREPMPEPSEPNLIERIVSYRGGRSENDGIHMLFKETGVDDLAWDLMGADNSTAQVNSGLSFEDCTEGRWFKITDGSALAKRHFGNSHGSLSSEGEDITESAYMSIPKPQYQADPREVAWHHLRVTDLRAESVPQEDRVRIMTAERATSPWLQ